MMKTRKIMQIMINGILTTTPDFRKHQKLAILSTCGEGVNRKHLCESSIQDVNVVPPSGKHRQL